MRNYLLFNFLIFQHKNFLTMTKKCQNCDQHFKGRPNQLYCSPCCKSAINNHRYRERDVNARNVELKVRANRNILSKLYEVFENKELPTAIVNQSNLDARYKTGVSKEGQSSFFLDFVLSKLSNGNFQITKFKAV